MTQEYRRWSRPSRQAGSGPEASKISRRRRNERARRDVSIIRAAFPFDSPLSRRTQETVYGVMTVLVLSDYQHVVVDAERVDLCASGNGDGYQGCAELHKSQGAAGDVV